MGWIWRWRKLAGVAVAVAAAAANDSVGTATTTTAEKLVRQKEEQGETHRLVASGATISSRLCRRLLLPAGVGEALVLALRTLRRTRGTTRMVVGIRLLKMATRVRMNQSQTARRRTPRRQRRRRKRQRRKRRRTRRRLTLELGKRSAAKVRVAEMTLSLN